MKYFGTDGIRGRANASHMTVETALNLGRAVAHTFSRERHVARILVGKDTRLSGYMLESALVAGITSTGADVILLGPVPTPGIAYLTTSMRADAGIVISASHNGFADNGLKVFGRDGFKLPDALERAIEGWLDSSRRVDDVLAQGSAIGRAKRIEDANGRYITHLKALLLDAFDLGGLRIVVDCANGAAYRAAPSLLEELGAEVIATGVSPNGLNINENCGSLHPQRAAALVREHQAHLGITLDGDADRVILVDEKGGVVDGDALLALCAIHLDEQGDLSRRRVAATVMSNMGLERALATRGIGLDRTAVGDRHVVQHMRNEGLNFGGEQSGHLIFLDHTTTGDGLAAAIQVLNVMLSTGRPLSELARVMQRVPQILVNRPVGRKRPLDELPGIPELMQRVTSDLGDSGRLLVRYSGTENKVRVMIEGEKMDAIETMANEVAEQIVRALL